MFAETHVSIISAKRVLYEKITIIVLALHFSGRVERVVAGYTNCNISGFSQQDGAIQRPYPLRWRA